MNGEILFKELILTNMAISQANKLNSLVISLSPIKITGTAIKNLSTFAKIETLANFCETFKEKPDKYYFYLRR